MTAPIDHSVSDHTTKLLRAAMERLLSGRPQRTDGRLIKDNLWKERRNRHAVRAELAARIRECTQLRRQLDAAATAIAALHHDNILLRQEFDHHDRVVALDAHHRNH
jgi:hypothetical protein